MLSALIPDGAGH